MSRKQIAAQLDETLEAMPVEMQHRVVALGAARLITLAGVGGKATTVAESYDLIELARFITGETEPGVTIPKIEGAADHGC